MRKYTVYLITIFLLLTPISLQVCQGNNEIQNSCCCGDMDEHYKLNATQENDCSCQLNEKKQAESQPVLFTSQQDNKSENILFISELELNANDFSQEFRRTNSNIFSQVSKGPPLYILHSSFII